MWVIVNLLPELTMLVKGGPFCFCSLSSDCRAQIKSGNNNRDNIGIIFLSFFRHIYCDPSLEPSQRDGSNEGSHCMFLLGNKKDYL